MYKISVFCVLLSVVSCGDESGSSAKSGPQETVTNEATPSPVDVTTEGKYSEITTDKIGPATTIDSDNTKPTHKPDNINFDRLHKLIIYGRASFTDVRQALTDTDASALTNTIHALYSMRWHRGVYNLLFDMWKLNKSKYPEFAWDQISKPPARIALASTINRIQIINTDEYKDYIRSFKHDEHEFHRAQVVVSLGFNGSPDDVEYIQTMTEGENHYVAQSAITALAIMGGNSARNAMIELFEKYKDTPRGNLVKTLLKRAYDWTPPETVVKTEEVSENIIDGVPD